MKAIVLAAGKGKRLMSERFDAPKVLREANGRPMIGYVLENIGFILPEDTVIVVGYKGDMVKAALGGGYTYAMQEQQKGTGHAVAVTEELFRGYTGDVIVTYGDMPLFKRKTYQALVDIHTAGGADATVLTAVTELPLAYGRVIRDAAGRVSGIVEDKDCTPEQKALRELNVGVYVFKALVLFEHLKELKNDNAQAEYYLTDIPKILIGKGRKVETYSIYNATEILGVNTVQDLERCEKILREEKGEL